MIAAGERDRVPSATSASDRGRRQRQRRLVADAGRNRVGEQRIERGVAERVEHALLIVGIEHADVAGDERRDSRRDGDWLED